MWDGNTWRAFQIQPRSRHGLGKLTYSGDNCQCQLSKFWFLLPTTKIFEIGSLTCITRRLCWLRPDVHVVCVFLWIELQILIFQEDCLECAAHCSFMNVSVFPNPYFWDNWRSRKNTGCFRFPQSTIIASAELWSLTFVLWAWGRGSQKMDEAIYLAGQPSYLHSHNSTLVVSGKGFVFRYICFLPDIKENVFHIKQ